MSDLMLLQDQWIDFLNQSKLHQCAPFVMLTLISALSLAFYTKINTWAIFCICLNPLSFIAYFLVGVAPFTTIPSLIVFGALYLAIDKVRRLKNDNT